MVDTHRVSYLASCGSLGPSWRKALHCSRRLLRASSFVLLSTALTLHRVLATVWLESVLSRPRLLGCKLMNWSSGKLTGARTSQDCLPLPQVVSRDWAPAWHPIAPVFAFLPPASAAAAQ